MGREYVEKEPFVLLCDNLEGQKADVFKESVEVLDVIVWYGQKADVFKESVEALDVTVWYGVADATDIWQPIDAGYAQLLKVLIKQEFFNWLDDEDNIDKRYGERVFRASDKRILITRWVGKTYRKICVPK